MDGVTRRVLNKCKIIVTDKSVHRTQKYKFTNYRIFRFVQSIVRNLIETFNVVQPLKK